MSGSEKVELPGFGLANYRSFDAEGFFVEKLSKINVFIGKNNCGKSNVLRALRILQRIKGSQIPAATTNPGLALKPEIDYFDRNGIPPSVSVALPVGTLIGQDGWLQNRLPSQCDGIVVRWHTPTGEQEAVSGLDNVDEETLNRLLSVLTGRWCPDRVPRIQIITELAEGLIQRALDALRTFDHLITVENFREIRQVSGDSGDDGTFNGYNIIQRLRTMQVSVLGEEKQEDVFRRIESFVADLLAEPSLQMQIPPRDDRIYLTLRGRKRLPLQSYGTGVHQLVILCAALAMYEGYVVSIEEPEIHLHPELQRKFFEFIAEETANTYFITTHSNVFLDFREDVSLYHVSHDGRKSTVEPVAASGRAREVLADLGYKASDLLQANCVIWVEGPSDRIYLNKYLSLTAPDLDEGLHYAITFYGGKNLAHFTAEDDASQDLVEVLRINSNAIVIMDRDRVGPDGQLNKTKERVLEELGEEECWVTEGREIENYLRSELIEQLLEAIFEQEVTVKFAKEDRLEEAIEAAIDGIEGPRIKYASKKVAYARRLVALMTEDDLDVLDLKARLDQIVHLIRKWNHIEPIQPPPLPRPPVAVAPPEPPVT